MERMKGETLNRKIFSTLKDFVFFIKVLNHYVPPSILIPEISITTKWGSAEGRGVENKVLCHEKLIPE